MIGLLLREALDRLHVRLNMYLVLYAFYEHLAVTCAFNISGSRPWPWGLRDVIIYVAIWFAMFDFL